MKNFKIVSFSVALLIAIPTLIMLVTFGQEIKNNFKEAEAKKMKLCAEATRQLATTTDQNIDLSFSFL